MKNNKSFLWLFFALSPLFSLSQQVSLPYSPQQLIQLFSQKSSLSWDFPTSSSSSINLNWQLSPNSITSSPISVYLSQGEGYSASVTIFNNILSAELYHQNIIYQIKTINNSLYLTSSLQEGYCGTCQDLSCSSNSHLQKQYSSISQSFTFDDFKNASLDNVIHVYRLALPIVNQYFIKEFNQNPNEVKMFWAKTEAALNKLYMRDLGVQFKVVDDDRLILSHPDTLYTPSATKTALNATETLNAFFPKELYDIALVITDNEETLYNGSTPYGLLGIAGVTDAYNASSKACGVAVSNFKTIAHEIGHLLGATHTHSHATDGISTEKKLGQSIMGYGFPADFFSLPSILSQIKVYLSKMSYFSNPQKTNIVKREFYYTDPNSGFNNYVYGIKTQNNPPILNTENLKTSYIVPENSFFQFNLSASDPDNDQISYMANPADINSSDPHYITYGPNQTGVFRFQTLYQNYRDKSGNQLFGELPDSYPFFFTTPENQRPFTFWLAARDSNLSPNFLSSITLYNLYQTKVILTKSEPFIITNKDKITNGTPTYGLKSQYKTGEKISLTWNNLPNLYPNSFVKISLSNDFGKTFSYTLLEKTPNDGSQDIILPQSTISTVLINYNPSSPSQSFQIPAGVIKVEILNELPYALSEFKPFDIVNNQYIPVGGFVISQNDISFTPTPPAVLNLSCPDPNISAPQSIPTATSSLSSSPQISYQDEGKKTDCSPHSFTRTWKATDGTNTTYFLQTINVNASNTTPPTPQPSSPDVQIFNFVSFNNSNYLRIENTDPSPIHLSIFNQNGQKLFESHNYQNEPFTGFSNTSTLSSSKRLPSGIYFYIASFQKNNTTISKSGYLFIR